MFSALDEIRYLVDLLVFHTVELTFLPAPEMKQISHSINTSVSLRLKFAHRITGFASSAKMTDKDLQINKSLMNVAQSIFKLK